MKKTLLLTTVFSSSLLVSGCLGDLIEFSCLFVEDDNHCYQSAAVQQAEPDNCENIPGTGFSGSNPPKDKCYILIAENTGDRSQCNNVQGGPGGYSVEECLAAADRYDATHQEEEREETEETETLSAGLEFKTQREAIFEDVGVEDPDVQSQVAQIFEAIRDDNPDMSTEEQLKVLKDVAIDQQTMKRLDEHANTLMDQIKSSATAFAEQTVDDLYGEDKAAFEQAMKDKGMEYFNKHAGKELKDGIARLESIKASYDKASEQYQAMNEQIEKLKAVYDEAQEVYGKIDSVNKMVADGKIEPGHAQALHGAIYLGKGLEYATKYVPVFGSTVSTISKETFEATVKFATERAQRTTALNKCIDDPENCDPNGISAY